MTKRIIALLVAIVVIAIATGVGVSYALQSSDTPTAIGMIANFGDTGFPDPPYSSPVVTFDNGEGQEQAWWGPVGTQLWENHPGVTSGTFSLMHVYPCYGPASIDVQTESFYTIFFVRNSDDEESGLVTSVTINEPSAWINAGLWNAPDIPVEIDLNDVKTAIKQHIDAAVVASHIPMSIEGVNVPKAMKDSLDGTGPGLLQVGESIGPGEWGYVGIWLEIDCSMPQTLSNTSDIEAVQVIVEFEDGNDQT